MSRFIQIIGSMACLSVLAIPAKAQWSVIDAPAIVQLVRQVQTMEQELQTAREQLTQAQQSLMTMTGKRGMELLLSGTTRNYLPSSWTQLTSAMQGAGGYNVLALDVRNAMQENAVLSAPQMSQLTGADQQRIVNARQIGALQQSLSQEALSNVSSRFAAIQSLIAAISTAADQKAILDLQARIGAEVGMLQNEQTKLQILNQATQARSFINFQQQREEVIAAHGQFASRFQPAP
jgi:type IV secretion system protein VirB5